MKLVLLLRHAEAVPSASNDHERPLSREGRAEAAAVGRLLVARGWMPDRAVVSDALRTRETLDALALPAATVRQVAAALYDASPSTIIEFLADAPPEAACQVLVGHNPGIALATRSLAGGGVAEALARLAAAFPTAAVAVLRFEGEDWSALAPGGGTLEAMVWPDDTSPGP